MSRPTEHFSLDGVPRPDRPERWAELLSETHVDMAVRVTSTGTDYRAVVRRQWIDDLALVDCECDPCSGTRGRSRIAASSQEYVAVLVTRRGRETLAQGEMYRDMRPGDAVVWDSMRPARFAVWEPLTKRTLLIPRAALDEVNGRSWEAGGVVLDGSAPATRLLTGYLDLLSNTLDELTPAAVTAARNATLELFTGAVRPAGSPAATAPTPVLRAAMEAWIDRHLAATNDTAVTPASIAAAHGVSVRTVHRTFESTGRTVGAVIRSRRLARARAELAGRGEPISVIARRWGFSDSSHFTRAFRARYGATPSDYRAQH
ncbi:MAG: AraC family transcriptional regulator, positive regulator of tynA and feaB [Pseudonocardiales bacterium]|nr:AraC family transcriptional regulator, positive regulator of tynA and feaB [Pseudonocardiales bacterium]MDT7686803.1 AraC family transcriptional regulator, positive regulator of tynA and feaB [Pseudonocardiales bacterium]